jgi:hypothetical protein
MASPALAGRSPRRMATATQRASGWVNRSSAFSASAIRPRRPPGGVHDRGRCPLYVRAQLDTVGLSWTQRDLDGLKAAAREAG